MSYVRHVTWTKHLVDPSDGCSSFYNLDFPDHPGQTFDWEKSGQNPEVNFINVFTRSFYACRSQKSKKLLELTAFFVHLGSVCLKA